MNTDDYTPGPPAPGMTDAHAHGSRPAHSHPGGNRPHIHEPGGTLRERVSQDEQQPGGDAWDELRAWLTTQAGDPALPPFAVAAYQTTLDKMNEIEDRHG